MNRRILRSPARPTEAEPDDLALRHVMPQVASQRRGSDALALVLGAALVGTLGLATFWSLRQPRAERPLPAPSLPATTAPAAPLAGSANPPPVPLAALTPLGAGLPPPVPALDNGRAPPQNPGGSGNPLASPAVVFNAPGPVDAAPLPTDPSAKAGTAANSAPANAADDFATRIGAVGSAGASAARAFDPHSTIAQGTLIPAVLETAIDTDVPGYARAVVSADVRAFDGSRVLVPRSSRLIGQYKSGMQAGQKRVYVIWTRLIRPDGVAVALGSPGTDFAGQSGIGGKVDSHFFERFGSAMLLTVMSGLSTLGSGGTSVVIAGSGQSAAAAAVGQTGQIGPTVLVHPGEPIRVFTARDLDFAHVDTP